MSTCIVQVNTFTWWIGTSNIFHSTPFHQWSLGQQSWRLHLRSMGNYPETRADNETSRRNQMEVSLLEIRTHRGLENPWVSLKHNLTIYRELLCRLLDLISRLCWYYQHGNKISGTSRCCCFLLLVQPHSGWKKRFSLQIHVKSPQTGKSHRFHVKSQSRRRQNPRTYP